MVFFFNNEKTDVIWEVRMSKDTFFTPLPLLGVLEGTSAYYLSYSQMCLTPFWSAGNICCKFQKFDAQWKKEIVLFTNYKLLLC